MVFYDFATGDVIAPKVEQDASYFGSGLFLEYPIHVPGRVIDWCATADAAAREYGQIVGINCGKAP